ncbi:MAG: hypothetical protein Fur0010_19770 [Bdellovibrio sp.]
MCDVCQLEGIDPEFRNGNKVPKYFAKLYRVYQGKIANIRMCHLHAIELFCIGESRFLQNHISLATDLSENRNKYLQSSYF